MQNKTLVKLARPAFFIALVVLLVFALAPVDLPVQRFSDKAQHLAGFFTLACLGLAAWGRRSALMLGLALAALGGAIEIVQSTPLIGRDAEVMDWVADVAGILLALLPAVFVRRAD